MGMLLRRVLKGKPLQELNALQSFLKGLRIKTLHLTKKVCEGKLRPWIKRIHGLAQRGKKPIQESGDEIPVPPRVKC